MCDTVRLCFRTGPLKNDFGGTRLENKKKTTNAITEYFDEYLLHISRVAFSSYLVRYTCTRRKSHKFKRWCSVNNIEKLKFSIRFHCNTAAPRLRPSVAFRFICLSDVSTTNILYDRGTATFSKSKYAIRFWNIRVTAVKLRELRYSVHYLGSSEEKRKNRNTTRRSDLVSSWIVVPRFRPDSSLRPARLFSFICSPTPYPYF